MLILALRLVVLIGGLLAYAFSQNPKAAEVGKLAYFAALLALLLDVGQQLAHLLSR